MDAKELHGTAIVLGRQNSSAIEDRIGYLRIFEELGVEDHPLGLDFTLAADHDGPFMGLTDKVCGQVQNRA